MGGLRDSPSASARTSISTNGRVSIQTAASLTRLCNNERQHIFVHKIHYRQKHSAARGSSDTCELVSQLTQPRLKFAPALVCSRVNGPANLLGTRSSNGSLVQVELRACRIEVQAEARNEFADFPLRIGNEFLIHDARGGPRRATPRLNARLVGYSHDNTSRGRPDRS